MDIKPWAKERWQDQVEGFFDDPWGYVGDGTQQTVAQQRRLVRETVTELQAIGLELGCDFWTYAENEEWISPSEIEQIRDCYQLDPAPEPEPRRPTHIVEYHLRPKPGHEQAVLDLYQPEGLFGRLHDQARQDDLVAGLVIGPIPEGEVLVMERWFDQAGADAFHQDHLAEFAAAEAEVRQHCQ